MKHFLLISLLFLTLPACYGISGNLLVFEYPDSKLEVTGIDGKHIFLSAGSYEMTMTEDGEELLITVKNGDIITLPLPKIPSLFSDSLDWAEPQMVSGKTIGQPFDLYILSDKSTIEIYYPNSMILLGRVEIITPKNKAISFLGAEAEYYRQQRAVIVPISSNLQDTFSLGDVLGKTAAAVADYGAMVYIAPWLESSYHEVRWLLGNFPSEEGRKTWSELLDKYPIIDYFAFVHSGSQFPFYAYDIIKKKKGLHQWRLAYTMACESKSSYEFITRYNVAMAGGHRGTSASFFFDFAVARNWTYGLSFEDSLIDSWVRGSVLARTVVTPLWPLVKEQYPYRDPEDLLRQSEMMVSYTPDLPPSSLFIHKAAVRKEEFLPTDSFFPPLLMINSVTELIDMKKNKEKNDDLRSLQQLTEELYRKRNSCHFSYNSIQKIMLEEEERETVMTAMANYPKLKSFFTSYAIGLEFVNSISESACNVSLNSLRYNPASARIINGMADAIDYHRKHGNLFNGILRNVSEIRIHLIDTLPEKPLPTLTFETNRKVYNFYISLNQSLPELTASEYKRLITLY